MMSSDGICVLVVEKLFKRINLDRYHDYKVNIQQILSTYKTISISNNCLNAFLTSVK